MTTDVTPTIVTILLMSVVICVASYNVQALNNGGAESGMFGYKDYKDHVTAHSAYFDTENLLWMQDHSDLIDKLFNDEYLDNNIREKTQMQATSTPETEVENSSFNVIEKRTKEMTDSEIMNEKPLRLALVGRDGVIDFPEKRTAPNCDTTKPTLRMLLTYWKTGQVCGFRATNFRFGIGRK